MDSAFSVECDVYKGVATTTAYIMDSAPELTLEEKTKRLLGMNSYRCLFDTGASHSAISKTVASTLTSKLDVISKVVSPNAVADTALYSVDILLPNNVVLSNVIVSEIENPIDIIIGLDVIGLGDFALSSRNGHPFLSFSYPHRLVIDLE